LAGGALKSLDIMRRYGYIHTLLVKRILTAPQYFYATTTSQPRQPWDSAKKLSHGPR